MLLIVSAETRPYLKGGMQERGSRAGTCNVPAVVAMGAAAESAERCPAPNATISETILLRAGAEIIREGLERLPTLLVRCSLFRVTCW